MTVLRRAVAGLLVSLMWLSPATYAVDDEPTAVMVAPCEPSDDLRFVAIDGAPQRLLDDLRACRLDGILIGRGPNVCTDLGECAEAIERACGTANSEGEVVELENRTCKGTCSNGKRVTVYCA